MHRRVGEGQKLSVADGATFVPAESVYQPQQLISWGTQQAFKGRAAADNRDLDALAGIRQSTGSSTQCQPWMAARS